MKNRTPRMQFLMIALIATATCALAEEWTLFTSLTDFIAADMAAADASNVWVLGTSSSSGTIYRFDGTAWQKEFQAYTNGESGELRSACALDADHVWAVGRNMTLPTNSVFFRDSDGWSLLAHLPVSGGSYVYEVYASDPTNLWACAQNGVILRSTNGGLSWHLEQDAGNQVMLAIDGVDERHVWAVGGLTTNQYIFFYDGSTWSTQYQTIRQDSRYFRDVHARSWRDVWVAGDNGYLAHYDGQGWTELPIAGCTNTINKAFVDSWNGENAWIGYAGTHRGVYFSDGSNVEISTNLSVNGLVCAGPAEAWFASTSGRMYRNIRRPEVATIGHETAISWNAIVGTTYDVEWAETPGGPWLQADTVRAGSLVCTWADLGGPGRPAPDDTTERYYRVVITGP